MKRLLKFTQYTVYDLTQKIKHKLFPDFVIQENRRKSTEKERQFDEKFEERFVEKKIQMASKSKSQLGQDVLALMILGGSEKFFVEFGATNGIDLSNTYLLENDCNWTGILAEPGVEWHSSLISNRTNSILDFRAIWTDSNQEILFQQNRERSALITNRSTPNNDSTYLVTTVSLVDLLKEHNAPIFVDYLSIDIEGHEERIIRSGVLEKYSFGPITLEHNYKANRYSILKYMRKAGYSRILSNNSLWDDWYIREDILMDLLGTC